MQVPDSIYAIRYRMLPWFGPISTALTIPQNRYIPMLHIIYKCLIMFDFTVPVSRPGRQCYHEKPRSRDPPAVVCPRPLYAPLILTR